MSEDLGDRLSRLDMELEDPLSTVVHRYKLAAVGELTDAVPELEDQMLLTRAISLEVSSITRKIRNSIEVIEITWSEVE